MRGWLCYPASSSTDPSGRRGEWGCGRWEWCVLIISSKNLLAYLDHMEFPVEIYEESADRVARVEDRSGLLRLIRSECVIGVGSWNRVRRLRMNRPMAVVALRFKLRSPLAEDDQTAVKIATPRGFCYAFHPWRSSAYARGRGPGVAEGCV